MEFLNNLFGLDTQRLSECQMVVRAVVAFFTALIFIRIAGIRTLGKQSAFDTLTLLMLGAIMGRAVVSAQSSFFGSLLAALAIMLLHRFISWITFKNKSIRKIIEGESILLMKDGIKISKNLSKSLITEEDILESARQSANLGNCNEVQEAYLERSGEISIIKK